MDSKLIEKMDVLFSRVCIYICGTLYPAYASFKTVRSRKFEDYVKWMMYWIVFAIFKAFEPFTDIFLAWTPLYYDFKVVLLLGILPGIGNGSSFIYRKFVHKLLRKHETQVDNHLVQIREKAQNLFLRYIKEAIIYIGRTIVNVINTSFPNGILGLLANNDINDNDTSIRVSSDIIIEEEEEIQEHVEKSSQSKTPTKTTNENSEEPQTSQASRPTTSKTHLNSK